ncbi:MAG: ester cyclase [Actinomycetota bacterium]|nr:ester cyclase [Actinomycetota bacterium]
MDDGGDFRSPAGKLPDKDAIRQFLTGFDAAFPDAHFDVEHVIEADHLVAVEGVYQGTHDGPLAMPDGSSLPPTGRRVHAPFATVLDVAGGRIRAHRPYWDLAGFVAQLTS